MILNLKSSKLFLFLLSSFVVSVILAGFFYGQENVFSFWVKSEKDLTEKKLVPHSKALEKVKTDRVEKLLIEPGETFTSLIQSAGISYQKALEIFHIAEPIYDLTRIRTNREIELTFDPEENLKKLKYHINTEEQLVITKATTTPSLTATSSPEQINNSNWQARLETIPYDTKIVIDQGVVSSSMYQAAQESDIDIRAIIALADVFQWTVDFAMGSQKGDTFKFVYEKKYLEGEYVRPGKILAAEYVNAGKKFQAYYYQESEDIQGYFNEHGESVQKMFLQAPLSYKYISSGFTTGPRYLAKFNTFTSSHRAIDYAADIGTPIRTVGDGVVTFAGWNSSGYGYLTTIRHNSTYTTRYAHQSKILVRSGQRVKQGEVIGQVGSTGFSTGPHLHYEMIKNGMKINPLNLDLPPSKSIPEEKINQFLEAIKPLQEKLKN